MKSLDRLDASLLTEEQRALLPELISLGEKGAPSLKGADGKELPLPMPIYQLLLKVIQDMRNGKAIMLLPEDELFTTQAAANYLGMSRQYLVGLLEAGKIPFHRVGTHRRVTLKDLRDYATTRDAERRGRLGALFKKVKDAGLYDAGYKGDAR